MYLLMVAKPGWKRPDTKDLAHHTLPMMMQVATNGHGFFLRPRLIYARVQR